MATSSLFDSNSEIEIIERVLEQLSLKIDLKSIYYSNKDFLSLRKQVRKNFFVPVTYITPIMERLLFALSSLKKPRNMLLIGVSYGNTLIWNIGSFCGKGLGYLPDRITAIDINDKAISIASNNFKRINYPTRIRFVAEDALKICKSIEEGIDYLYLDADDKENGKGLYFKILQILYDKLSLDAWILAHDATYKHGGFQEQLSQYFKYVRNPKYFKGSYTLPVDKFGLELSIR